MTIVDPDVEAASTLARPDYALADALWADRGQVFLSGNQALVRLLLMQRAADEARGLDTRGFVSGYRGSPLGMLDQAIWKAGKRFTESGLHFVPAVNEELAATQVLGTQRVESDPLRTADGVFALWYGKGPGVDRAGDAIKHGNAYGSSPHGGVLVVAGDDHGCVSSSMPHQSDQAMQAWSMPVVAPASVAEYLEFGLYGWALSRYSGNWVGMTALSEVVESSSTVDLDLVAARAAAWQDAGTVRRVTGHQPPADGLHYRWPDLPSLRIETRLVDKLAAVAAFARVNSIDREVIAAPTATVGIVTCGKAHFDLLEVLRRLELTPAMLAAAGIRLYKVGLAFPIEQRRIRAFARGLREILVVEEKGPVVEAQLRDLFYNAPAEARPMIVGKRDRDEQPLVSAVGELRPSRLIELVARWLTRHFPEHAGFRDAQRHVRDFTVPALHSNAADAVKRLPYFCAGCPHNTSTRVPEGSSARAGIGCHFMASWMDRDTAGLIQMGGEGVDWVSHARFTSVPHVFQNLGDGTYFHSGYLAIRQAVAAKANITYKILYNDAVAMTGGQPIDGVTSVDAIARQVESEGVKRVVVLSDDIGKYRAIRHRFPGDVEFHPREALDAVQRRLREIPGVTVLIYEQTCAAEKRRRRKKGELAEPATRVFINEAVCEGCGDCTVQSNCVAVLPDETPLGRKRRIDQGACNKDYSCTKGFCPSFVTVTGGVVRKRAGALLGEADDPSGGAVLARFEDAVAGLRRPPAHRWEAPYDLLVTGVGGTGVVTVGALVAMAAHLEGKSASVLDFMGFAQKGGAVLSFVRLADVPERLNQVRIDTQQADAILACDLVVGASPEALQTVRHGRTRILANRHEVPVADSMRNPDSDLMAGLLLEKMRAAAGDDFVVTFDAQEMAEAFLGDTIAANVLALGFAWQHGVVPVSLEALLRAIELNGVAVRANRLAFSLGRLAAADPTACRSLLAPLAVDDVAPIIAPITTTAATAASGATPVGTGAATAPGAASWGALEAMRADAGRDLVAYQGKAWARRFDALVAKAAARERELGGDGAFSLAVARSLRKLMTYKDEYEVARLYTDGSFAAALSRQFEGDLRLRYHMAPPLLSRSVDGKPPRKIGLGPWMGPAMRLLAHGRMLRGTFLDPFGHTAERRTERELIAGFERRIDELLPTLTAAKLPVATQLAAVPLSIRGFGHVKLGNLALARVREAELLHRLDPQRHPPPPRSGPPPAGQLRGIQVVARA
ncbi:MAG: indolepyruvate ferredoxin oxidoreductase family protein [Burkholderiaceae bacterium]|nr:indolepyruvate ferredoxin oxidoreductase family protein [Burkholderiaceae bacterium]